MKFLFFIFVFAQLFTAVSFAADELVVIQAVSTTRKTFAVRKGFSDGIGKGQESLFTNKNTSFSATATDVNRFFSVWSINDKRGSVPFDKGEFVTFTNSVENVYFEIPYAQSTPEELTFRPSSKWIFRTHFSFAISESVSETEASRYAGRSGFQVEFFFNRNFTRKMDWGIGLRFDKENTSLEDQNLDVPTNRTMLAAEFTYHFDKMEESEDNMYLSAGGAYGLTNTTVNDDVSAGTVMVFPYLKLGYVYKWSPSYDILFELTGEAIAASEAFEGEESQTTNVVNTKFGIGVRF